MIRQIFVAAGVLALAANAAQGQTKVVQGPIQRTTIDGKTMYDNYCAVCHGKEGTGGGPAAPALKKAPTDLTMLAARNKGVFPEIGVRRYIEGVDEVASHGSRDMPMWGDLFKSLDRDMAPIRASALVAYVKTLQKK